MGTLYIIHSFCKSKTILNSKLIETNATLQFILLSEIYKHTSQIKYNINLAEMHAILFDASYPCMIFQHAT
jgi:hypothetical protein